MNKKIFTKLAVCAFLFALFVTPSFGYAYTLPEKPAIDSMIVDEAGIIKKEEYDQINLLAFKLLAEEKVPLYVVTIPSLSAHEATGYTIESYAENLFNDWGIGFEDRNYGILLLVSVEDRKARIELGADWAHNYDTDAKHVMHQLIVPQFKAGAFSLGILDGARGLDAMARNLALPKPTAPWWFLPLVIATVIGLILLIINLFKTGRSGWAWALIVAIGLFLLFMIKNSATSSGSGGGFGGGFSGGGGATGSW